MRKEVSFLIVAAIIALGIVLIYYWGGQPTGFVTKLDEYQTETACVEGGYVWYEENCYEEQPICSLDFLELCEDETACVDAGYVWEEIMGEDEDCVLCEENCVNEYTEILCVEGCQETCEGNETCILCEEGCVNEYTEILCAEGCQETCEEIVVDGQCVEYVCDAEHLELCLDETNCTEIGGGFWYAINEDEDPICNPEPLSCNPSWRCGSWTPAECPSSEIQTRTCLDENECGIDKNKPKETQTCSYSPPQQVLKLSLSADNIENLKLNQGASSEISWNVKNDGELFLSSCTFEARGDYAEWIYFDGAEFSGISVGNTVNFDFSVNVPDEAEEGEYTLIVAVKCAPTTEISKQFILEVEAKKLQFDIIDVQRTRADRVRVIYLLSELIGEDQEVNINFLILDAENQEVANAIDNREIKANSEKEFKTNIMLDEFLEGEMSLEANFNSEIYSSSVREPIVLGAPVGGFVIFEGIGTGGFIIFVVVLFVLAIAFIFARRMKKSGKTLKDLLSTIKKFQIK